METNFFTSLAQLPKAGMWKISINTLADGQLLVSVLLENGSESKTLAPIVFNGLPKELDEGFFEAMDEPAKQTAELFVQLDAHRLSVEKAQNELREKAKLKSNSSNGVKTETQAEQKKRYDGLIEKAKKLNEQTKYAEALEILPSNSDFPEKSKELNGLRAKLTERREQKEKMSLFNT